MTGILALFASLLAFVVPLTVVLSAQKWKSFLSVLATGVLLFGWMTWDFAGGGSAVIGEFLAGLMLFGFSAGAIAKFVMLIGRTKT